MNTQYRKNLKDVATACKNYTDKRFDDFKWELGTHTIDTTTDSDVAYQKQAPNGTIGCQIENVGGMSYKSENLLVLSDVALTDTGKGITYSVTDGVLSINGTASDDVTIRLQLLVPLTLNGAYILAMFNTNNVGSIGLYDGTNFALSSSTTSANTIKSGTLTNYNALYFNTWISNGSVINASCKPMLVRGSTAPTTFKQGFENIRDSAVTSVVANSTLNIPASIQALTGYGWGINDTCYNYIDFNTKKFVQKVGRVVLNGSTLYQNTGWSSETNISTYTPLPNSINQSTTLKIDRDFEISASGGNSRTTDQIRIASGNVIYINFTSNGGKLSEFTLAKAKEWLSNNNLTVYYELATPVETDISSYITDNDKFLEVEALGTITFNNTYEQEVPSEITYLTEVAK